MTLSSRHLKNRGFPLVYPKNLSFEDVHELFENGIRVGRELYFVGSLDMITYNQSDYENYLDEQSYIEKFAIRLTVQNNDMSISISPTMYTAREDASIDIDWQDIFEDDGSCPSWATELIRMHNDHMITHLCKDMKDGEYAILQLDDSIESVSELMFRDYDFCKEKINSGMYQVVYRQQGFVTEDDLDTLYTRFNMGKKPYGYYGHSLSVSDVIIIKSGNLKAYFVDSVGFEELPEHFLLENAFGYIRIPLIRRVYLPKKEDGTFNIPIIDESVGIDYFSGEKSFKECRDTLWKANALRADATWNDIISCMRKWLHDYTEYYQRVGG